ncbi:MAG TPA: hypothetical protein VLK79_16635 [Gaiellales bacterium]|nr:hypothetical protein [Gaiellales bacterium]
MTGPGAPPSAAPLPGWLGPVVTLTTQVGVPTVFAGILLWFVLTQVGAAMERMQRAEDERTRSVAAMQTAVLETLDHLGVRFEAAINENIQANRELAAAAAARRP